MISYAIKSCLFVSSQKNSLLESFLFRVIPSSRYDCTNLLGIQQGYFSRYLNPHTSNEKKSPKIGNPFWHEKQCIFTNQPSYFWLFLPICESVANLHKSTAEYPCLFLPIFRYLTCDNL